MHPNRSWKTFMAVPTNTPLTGESSHLSVDDLLAPLPETARLGGPGPFVINLNASSAPISVPMKGIAGCHAYVYQVQRMEDRRPRYRLRLGPFTNEDEADTILKKVRDVYPGALTATADAEDLRTIATLEAKALQSPAGRPGGGGVPQSIAAKPAPSAAPMPSAMPMASTMPMSPVSVLPVVPTLSSPVPVRRQAESPAQHLPGRETALAASAMPTASPKPAPAPAPAAAAMPTASPKPAPAPAPAASVMPTASLKSAPAPAPAASAMPTASPKPAPAPAPAASVMPTASAKPAPSPAPAAFVTPTASPKPAPSPVPTAFVTPTASTKPAPSSAPMASAVPTVERRSAVRVPAAVPTLSAPVPNLETTQTVRALTQLELEDDNASRWFVIQLSLAEETFDPDTVPNLDIFSVYRLYSVAGIDQGRIVHALRLGFFTEETSAGAVASYLADFYDKPTIKRVSAAERERFAEQSLAPRKDVGATGKHAAIEITSERFVRERRSGQTAAK
jgi:SPOR domain